MKRVVVTLFTMNMEKRKVNPKANLRSLQTDRIGMKRNGLLGGAGYLRRGSGSGIGRRLELRAGELKAIPLLCLGATAADDDDDAAEALTPKDALRMIVGDDDILDQGVAAVEYRRGATKPSAERTNSKFAAAAMKAHFMVSADTDKVLSKDLGIVSCLLGLRFVVYVPI
jgi:hypothetical protein